jgi:phytanoyl-CoA hydroxylase
MSSIKEQFERDGYYVAKSVFSHEEIRRLESDFDRIVTQITSTGESTNAKWNGPEMEKLSTSEMVVTHTHNVQNYSAVWSRALFQENFLAVTSEILGEDIVLHHTKLFQKPAENGAPFPMHQDWDYFPTEKNTMIAGVIHVSKATDEMGCLRVYPGSHKLGRLDQSNGTHMGEIFENYKIEGSTPVEVEAGDIVFFHYCTIHGSLPNRSNEIRKTVLVQMHSGDDRVEDGITHPNARLVLQGFNHHQTRNSAGLD